MAGGVTRKKRVRRTRRKRGPTNKQLSKRITKLEHDDELKYIDYAMSSTPFNNTTTFNALTLIAQGDDFNQRVGEEITAKFLNLEWTWTRAANTDPLLCRMILFWDMQTNGTSGTPFTSGGNLQQGLLDNSTITYVQLTPHNYRCKQRYKVLMDKKFILNPQSSSTANSYHAHKSFKLGGAKVKYSDSGATIASLPSRSLLLYIYSVSASADTNNVYRTSARLWFTDS